MKKIILLVLFGVYICICVEECLDYDDVSSLSYLKSKQSAEDMHFAMATTVQTMKDYGFGICLEYFNLDSKRREVEIKHLQKHLRLIEGRSSARCITTNRGAKIKEEVEKYLADYKKKSIEEMKSIVTKDRLKELLETPPLLRKCLSLYESTEYQAKVKHIVKKYCKDCK